MSSQHNIPVVEFKNLFDADRFAEPFFKWLIGADRFSQVQAHFISMGEAGALATPLSKIADVQGPKLTQYDSVGNRIDQVDYHPAYIELQKLSYGRGIVGKKFDKSFLAQHKDIRHRLGFGAGWYFAQTETGLYCPICMTDALARVLEIHGKDEKSKLALKHLASTDMAQLWQGAMFLTERQGGSDVGQNIVQAEQKNGQWFLTGHKWFCSNADAKVILALARMPNEEGDLSRGTRGLGLFLVLRDDPKETSKTILIHRLKEKLGVRSMASAEIDFVNTPAYLIGGANEGFRMMADMVNMSRLYNAVASLGVMQRSCLEALHYGVSRKAFGKALTELPLWRSQMAKMLAEAFAMRTLVFYVVKLLDQADGGSKESASLVRILTPLIKAEAGKMSVQFASEAMELIGGNAYIEEHIMPRLLRDAQVLPIWEGTSNIQSLDFLRALAKEGFGHLTEFISHLNLMASDQFKDECAQLRAELETWLKESPELQQLHALLMLKKTSLLLQKLLLANLEQVAGLEDMAKLSLRMLEEAENSEPELHRQIIELSF